MDISFHHHYSPSLSIMIDHRTTPPFYSHFPDLLTSHCLFFPCLSCHIDDDWSHHWCTPLSYDKILVSPPGIKKWTYWSIFVTLLVLSWSHHHLQCVSGAHDHTHTQTMPWKNTIFVWGTSRYAKSVYFYLVGTTLKLWEIQSWIFLLRHD